MARSLRRLVMLVLLLSPPANGIAQSDTDAAVPHTSWGDPDLRGIWRNDTLSPLERPAEDAGKEFLSEAELAERKSEAFDRYLEGIGLAADAAISGEFTQDWMESGSVTRRTSLIVGPDGTMPPLTPQAEARRAAVRASGDRPLDSHEDRPLGERCLKFATGGPPMRDSHEDRPLGERCLKFATGGPPMSPFVFLSLVHILQTPEHVALIVEENHATRVVPLDGRSHIDPRLRLWRGNSVGRWEGETLVIETTNFSGKGGYRGAGEGLRLTERLRRLDADTVLYGFTVNDPDTLGSTVDG